MVEWIQENTKEVLSAIGAVIVGIVGLVFKKNSDAKVNKQKAKAGKNSTINQAGRNISINRGGKDDEK